MTEPIKKQPYPESGAGDDWWPFDDNDLDDYERELEAAYIPKACRPPDPEWEAESGPAPRHGPRHAGLRAPRPDPRGNALPARLAGIHPQRQSAATTRELTLPPILRKPGHHLFGEQLH